MPGLDRNGQVPFQVQQLEKDLTKAYIQLVMETTDASQQFWPGPQFLPRRPLGSGHGNNLAKWDAQLWPGPSFCAGGYVAVVKPGFPYD